MIYQNLSNLSKPFKSFQKISNLKSQVLLSLDIYRKTDSSEIMNNLYKLSQARSQEEKGEAIFQYEQSTWVLWSRSWRC